MRLDVTAKQSSVFVANLILFLHPPTFPWLLHVRSGALVTLFFLPTRRITYKTDPDGSRRSAAALRLNRIFIRASVEPVLGSEERAGGWLVDTFFFCLQLFYHEETMHDLFSGIEHSFPSVGRK